MTTQYMREALDLARKGRSLASPNPLVGAVLVREGEVVGRGFHTYAGLHHAEIIAIEGRSYRLQESPQQRGNASRPKEKKSAAATASKPEDLP